MDVDLTRLSRRMESGPASGGGATGGMAPTSAHGAMSLPARPARRSSLVRSGGLLVAGNAASAMVLFLRNVTLARLIPVPDYGIAMTFAIAMAAVEMGSYLAFDRLLVQAADGDRPHLQATLQTLQVLRGALIGGVLFLTAGPIAYLLGAQEAVWAFQLLSVVVLMRGFAHLDIFRLQRDSRFLPSVSVQLLAHTVGTLAIVPFALWTGDWRAMLWSLLLQEAAFLTLSHLIAASPYRLGWNWALARRSLAFGWPLMVNGLVLFAIFYGDRIIIANQLGIEAMALFAAAFTLTLAPTLILAKSAQTLLLPALSRSRERDEGFAPLAVSAVEFGLLAGLSLAVGFAILGPWVFGLLFGPAFAPAAPLVVWLAMIQAVRVAKSGPATVSIAGACTHNPLVANLVRVGVLPVTFLAAASGGELLVLIKIGLAGETLALVVSLFLARRRPGLRMARLRLPLALFAMTIAAIGTCATLDPSTTDLGTVFDDAGTAAVLALFTLFLASLRDLWAWVWTELRTAPPPKGDRAGRPKAVAATGSQTT